MKGNGTNNRNILLAAAVAGMLCAGGCGQVSERQTYYTAVNSYAATMEAMSAYRAAGIIDDEAAMEIEPIRQQVRAALDLWGYRILNDEPVGETIDRFRRAMDELLLYRLQAEQGGDL
jgi:hypothetical protein